jgi:preprotein translocase subunit SecG
MDGMLFPLLLTMHIIVGLSVIGLVLLQHGKGADMGAAFGSGASGSLFGASGSANFMSRTTAVLAAVFFMTSLSLAYMASNRGVAKEGASVMDNAKSNTPAPLQTRPANPAPEPLGVDSKAKEIPK